MLQRLIELGAIFKLSAQLIDLALKFRDEPERWERGLRAGTGVGVEGSGASKSVATLRFSSCLPSPTRELSRRLVKRLASSSSLAWSEKITF